MELEVDEVELSVHMLVLERQEGERLLERFVRAAEVGLWRVRKGRRGDVRVRAWISQDVESVRNQGKII